MSKLQRNVLFTFDYELYLGVRSGTVDSCLIIPTNRLLTILSRHRIKAIFFVDTTYLIKLQELKEHHSKVKADWLKIIDQLQSIFLQGHEVFPHLHPHWLDAKYKEETNEWNLGNFSKYRFNSISKEERDLVWERSYSVLKSIIHSLDPSYKFDGYRAGGWSIQPFSDFRPYFEKYGVKNEFSVRPGYKLHSTAHQYDFIASPQKNIYLFEEDVLVEDEKGSYKQFTISSIEKLTGILKFIDKVLYRLLLLVGLRGGYGNGVTVAPEEIYSETKNKHYEKLEMVSVEHLSLARLLVYFKFLRQNNYMQFLSHPKMVSEFHLFCLNIFLRFANAFYFLNTDFRKIHQKND